MGIDHDRDIRPHLIAALTPRASWLCEEFSADGKVDVATVEDRRLCGYEIKAARDTLKRLTLAGGAQVEMFSRTFDRVTLVCAAKHVRPALAIVPAWWGITVASVDGFAVHREAADNPNDPTPRMAWMLWSDEALSLLRSHGMHRGARTRGAMSQRIATLPREAIRAAVFDALRAREWGPVRKRKPMVRCAEVWP